MSDIGAMKLGLDATAFPLPRGPEAMMRALSRDGADRGEHATPQAPGFRDQLRKSAEQLVASALLMPVLEEMSNSPLRPEDGPFAENVVEKRFGPMLHQHLADRMMQSRSFGLVDAVVARFGGQRDAARATVTPRQALEVTG